MVGQLDLTFRVPDVDFDGISLEVALEWAEDALWHALHPIDETGAMAAYRILQTIHARYMDTLGHPEWKRLPLADLLTAIQQADHL